MEKCFFILMCKLRVSLVCLKGVKSLSYKRNARLEHVNNNTNKNKFATCNTS
jgi:hypothetical protein